MDDERHVFFTGLLAHCSANRQLCLTFSAIHPDGQHPTPSRHIPLENAAAMQDALERLDAANALGWGAYFAVGLRRSGLTRWQRGRSADVVALPALYADVDDHSPEALTRLEHICPRPSCIVGSGGGYHAYWWLDEPTTDLEMARRILRVLAAALGGDSMSVAQSLRLVGSVNTKPGRNHAPCHLLELTEQRYVLSDFMPLFPRLLSSHHATSSRPVQVTSLGIPNADLIALIVDVLTHRGCKWRGDWLNGTCPFPERHKHGDHHPSFGFNVQSGYGYCHVCGTMLLKDLSAAFGIVPARHGGIYRSL